MEGFLHVRFLRRVTRHKTMQICSSYVVVVAQSGLKLQPQAGAPARQCGVANGFKLFLRV